MKIKKLYEDAIVPTKAYEGDAGFDVYSPINGEIKPGDHLQIKLGIAIQINQDEVCEMQERSGMAIKYGIKSCGPVIDSGYRGEISITLKNGNRNTFEFYEGDKIGQMVIKKLGDQSLEVVDELDPSQRGENAHYSSGK